MTKYWEPHTSSMDFCETNYVHSNHVVEYHNSWSSLLGLFFIGVIGIRYNNPTKEIRTVLAYLTLALIGLGSTGLHSTLHWVFQSSDELPMIYLCNVVSFMFIEFDAPRGKAHYPMLPYILAALSIVQTVVYYRFQHNYVIFILAFSIGIVMVLALHYRVVVQRGHQRGPISKRLGRISILSFLFVGFPIWILDMHFCDQIVPVADSFLGMWKGCTPHVVWHFCSGFGAYCAVACTVTCRLEELKVPFKLEYMFGVLPVTAMVGTATQVSEKVTNKND